MKDILIVPYKTSYSANLLRLLLALQKTYFQKKTPPNKYRNLEKRENEKKSYSDYIKDITKKSNASNWKILMAVSADDKAIGFIIGSVETDHYLVKNKVGKFEDWFVEEDYRSEGVGIKLYNELEKWFKKKGCQQVVSDTWYGNDISIHAHEKLGFFKTGATFGKKLK